MSQDDDDPLDDIERFLAGDGRAMMIVTLKAGEGVTMDDQAIDQFRTLIELFVVEHRAEGGAPVVVEPTRFPDERTAQVILRRYDVATWNELIQIN